MIKDAKSLYCGHRFPAAVISCALRWYFRFRLSLRDIEELQFEFRVVVSYDTVRRWRDKFGVCFGHRVKATRCRPSTPWHLDEVLDVTRRASCGGAPSISTVLNPMSCYRSAATRLQRSGFLTACSEAPREIVTDQLRNGESQDSRTGLISASFVKASARIISAVPVHDHGLAPAL
ncbi:hypothetical protein OKW50_008224 [Paraburkholderia youngii]